MNYLKTSAWRHLQTYVMRKRAFKNLRKPEFREPLRSDKGKAGAKPKSRRRTNSWSHKVRTTKHQQVK